MASSRLERLGTIYTRVEGLLSKGAMKPDDRPIWFDVYKRFPPTVEPKFSRPKPEIKPIKQIFYKEDIIRAKIHSQGYGLGAVNMLNPSGETSTRRVVEHYKKLQFEGVPEDQILEKCAIAVESERRPKKYSSVTETVSPNQPESVSQQILNEVDIKNIFKKE